MPGLGHTLHEEGQIFWAVLRVWTGAFADLMVQRCCQVLLLFTLHGIVSCSEKLCMQILFSVLLAKSAELRSS